MRFALLAAAATVVSVGPVTAQAPTSQTAQLRPDQQAFLELYRELVETDTSITTGNCTQAAAQVAARMKAAGFTDQQLVQFSVPEHPKEGGLVAILPGTSKTLKPILLLAHIDVVTAKREDWERDPYKLVEENGYYYARGVVDDKFQSAMWADTLIRLKQRGKAPKRTIKMALTCGEETSGAFNGAEWLAANRRDLIDAEFAINEGGGGRTDGKATTNGGKLLIQTLQVGEKVYQDFTLTATNPGGHSSQPEPTNAIYEMSRALDRISAHKFPVEFSDTTRAFFAKAGTMRPDDTGKAMVALTKNLNDGAALALVERDKALNSLLRTTCVATMIDGGHALNALPQRVEANVNCRIFPGHSPAEIKDALTRVIGNDRIKIAYQQEGKPLASPPPLDPKIVGPVERLAAKYFPGVPVIPAMSTGATDAVYTGGAGIPTYGVPGHWIDPDFNGVHGLNERIEVRAVYTGRDYLFDLVNALASK